MATPSGHAAHSPPATVDRALTFFVRGALGLWLLVLALSVVHLV